MSGKFLDSPDHTFSRNVREGAQAAKRYNDFDNVAMAARKRASLETRIADAVGAKDIIELDIGGTLFSTDKATLASIPDSLLGLMLQPNSQFGAPARTSAGRVFLDRDGTYFQHVLNHYRNVTLPSNLSEDALTAIRHEAEYYGLTGLVQQADPGRRTASLRDAVRVQKGSVGHSAALINLGHRLYEDGDIASALRKYDKALAKMNDSEVALYVKYADENKGSLLESLNLLIAARLAPKDIRRGILDRVCQMPTVLPELALELLKLDDFAAVGAFEELNEILETRPHFPEALYGKGFLLQKHGRLEDALTGISKAIGFRPNYLEAHLLKSELLTQLGRAEDALGSWRAASNLDPLNGTALLGFGKALMTTGFLQQAEEVFQKLAKGLDSVARKARKSMLRKHNPVEPTEHTYLAEAMLSLAKVYGRQDKWLKAVEELDNISALRPNSLEIALLRAEAWVNSRYINDHYLSRIEKTGNAKTALSKVFSIAPNDPYALFLSGKLSFDEGAFSRAEEAFASALRFSPEHIELLISQAKAVSAQDRKQEATSFLSRAILLDETLFEPHLELAKLLYALGRPEEALLSANRALLRNTESAEALQIKAMALLDGERLEEAHDALQVARVLAPHDVRSKSLLGQTFQAMGREAQAMAVLTSLPSHNSTDFAHVFSVGKTFFALRAYESASKWLARATAIDTKSVEALLQEAVCLTKIANLKKISASPYLVNFDKILTLYPNCMDAQKAKGDILFQSERFSEALKCYDAVLEKELDDVDIMYSRAFCLQALKVPSNDVFNAVCAILNLRPNHAKANFLWGSLLKQTDRPAEALEAFSRSSQYDSENSITYQQMGLMQLRLGRPDEALQSFDAAIRISPESGLLLFEKGKALLELKRFAEAFEAFDLSLSYDQHRQAEIKLIRTDLLNRVSSSSAGLKASGK